MKVCRYCGTKVEYSKDLCKSCGAPNFFELGKSIDFEFDESIEFDDDESGWAIKCKNCDCGEIYHIQMKTCPGPDAIMAHRNKDGSKAYGTGCGQSLLGSPKVKYVEGKGWIPTGFVVTSKDLLR